MVTRSSRYVNKHIFSLAKLVHPDRCHNDSRAVRAQQIVNLAKDVLSSPIAEREHHIRLEKDRRCRAARQGPPGGRRGVSPDDRERLDGIAPLPSLPISTPADDAIPQRLHRAASNSFFDTTILDPAVTGRTR